MKESNYFDYDGNISSNYSSADFAVNTYSESDGGNAVKSEKLEPVLSALSAPSLTENISAVNENDGISEEAPVLSEELTAAIEAFEAMNLPREGKKAEKPEKDSDTEIAETVSEPAKEEPEPDEEKKKRFDKKEALEAAEAVAGKVKSVAAVGIKKLKSQEEKEVSRLKHFFIILLLMILVIVIFTGVIVIFMQSINKENERSGEFSANAAEVCAAYSMQYGNPNCENLYDLYKVEGYRLTGLCFIRELDFNNDGESELMLTYNKSGIYYNEVWGISGKKKEFTLLYSEAAANHKSKAKDAYSLLYRTRNKYYIARFDGDSLDKFSLMQYKGDKFEKKYDGEYDSKTRAYSVDGKDDTNAFERIKYSVLKEERASVDVDEATAVIESFNVNGEVIETHDNTQTLENAYYQVVQDYNKRYGVCTLVEKNGDTYIDGLAVVELIDFDGNGKNELLLVYRKPVKVRDETASGENVTYEVNKYFCDIYRYSGSRAVLSYTNEGLSNKLNYRTDIYYIIRREKKKAYYCLNTFTNSDYGNHITAVSAEYKFDGTSFTTTFKSSYTTDYGYSDYYLEGKDVDKYEFNREGYKNPFFDCEEDYDKEHYRITYVQRRSADAGNMKEIPKQTEQTIQKLNQLYSADIKN